jgi:hypothetical protein
VFIEQKTSDGKVVIINGDLLECLYFNFMKVLKANHNKILAVVQNPLVFIIPGNHSAVIGNFQPFFPSMIYDRMILGRYNIFHGHELDDLVNKPYLRKPTKLLAKLVAHYSEESNSSWLIDWSRAMSKAEHENAKLIEVLQKLDPIDSVSGSDAPVILSHTHQEYDYEGWYFNTGSFSTPKMPYLEVYSDQVYIKYYADDKQKL